MQQHNTGGDSGGGGGGDSNYHQSAVIIKHEWLPEQLNPPCVNMWHQVLSSGNGRVTIAKRLSLHLLGQQHNWFVLMARHMYADVKATSV